MHSKEINKRTIFFIIFTISGFAGLIYESIWTHYLKLFLGHSAYAQTLVLAIFMGGMALGSWICSHTSGRWSNLLKAYAIAEAIIGLLALFFHPVYVFFLEQAYANIIPALSSANTINLFKWGSAALFILPQSILLGMTFPLMSAGLIRRFPETPGATIAMLYFSNSIGAAIGVLVSGFVFLSWFGLAGTIAVAGLINLVLAAVVWKYSRHRSFVIDVHRLKNNTIKPPVIQNKEPTYRLLLIVALVTGLASFIYEIGWIRMLNMVLGSATHAFELMLSAFIAGLALGGLWIKTRIDSLVNPTRFLAYVQLIMGGFALATLPFYNNVFEVMQWLILNLDKNESGYALFNLSSHAIALAIMLPTTFCAGMTLPLITYLLLKQGQGEKSIGAVYAFNTLGSILGIIIATHLLMPYVGLKNLITFGALLDISLGLLLLWCAFPGKTVPAIATITSLLLLLISWVFVDLDPTKMASGVYRSGQLIDANQSKIIYSKDGKSATINVIQKPNHILSITTNGKSDASINMDTKGHRQPDENTMILTGALPLAIHPTAKNVALIGMGSGLSTHTLLGVDSLDRVDTIEIESAMVDGAKYFGEKVERAYNDPRSYIHIEDAKTYFSTQNKKYDAIISEPSNPWVSGVSGLFSEEFYHHMKRYLKDDGVLIQWLQVYEIDMPLVSSVIKALANNFNDYVIYAANFGDIIIVAKQTGKVADIKPEIFNTGLRAELKKININNFSDLQLRRIGDKQLLQPLFLSYNIRSNSDYYPVLDLGAAAARYIGKDATALINLYQAPIPVLELLGRNFSLVDSGLISMDINFPRSIQVNIAKMLNHYVTGGQWKWNNLDVPLPVNIRSYADITQSAIMRCNTPISLNDWLSSTYNTIAKRIIPYLTSAEQETMWNKLQSHQCWQVLHPLQRDLIHLYKAVSMRNGHSMAQSARNILKHANQVDEVLLEYLLAAGMAGELANNNVTGAQQLWHDYSSKLDRKIPLYLRLLLAHSFTSDLNNIITNNIKLKP
jgi:spermidine synthase